MDMKNIGIVILSAVAIIICINLLIGSGISTSVTEMTTTRVQNSDSVSCAAATTLTLQGKSVSGFSALNESNATNVIPASNYTISNNKILSDGTLGATVLWKSGTLTHAGAECNISYTYEPLGYATDSGTRSVAGIIIIFCCLVIVIISLVPTLKSDIGNIIPR